MLERVGLAGNKLIERAKDLLTTASGRLPFHEQIPLNLRASTMWFELQKAIADSTTSEIWPNEYVTVRSDGLEPHAIIEADYKLFFAHSVYHYKVTEFEAGSRFVYTAMKSHAFEGGGEVEIRPLGKRCILQWSGEYRFEPTQSPRALVFKLYFQERFFAQLRENLRRFEERLSYS